MRRIYLTFSVVGTVMPWVFFGSWIGEHGLAPFVFLGDLFANGAAAGFSTDVLLSIAVFWLWSYGDARQLQVRRWWLVLPAGFFVGLSLALPLYLYFREPHSRDLPDSIRQQPNGPPGAL